MGDALMTPKQEQFVREYLIDLNATQSAIRAGYSERTASEQSARLLGDVRIQAAIQLAMAAREQRTEITQDRVLEELAKIGFANLSDIVAWGSKEISVGYDADGKRLSPQDISDAVVVHSELAPYVEAVPSDELPEAARHAVSEVALTKDGLKIKMHDKNAALVSIGRHLGMFKDKVDLTGTITLESLILASMTDK